jgi:hypothetical protein
MQLASASEKRQHLAPKPVRAGTAECLVGVERRDITPPVGIHNRNWGASASDVATGIHKPLFATALAFAAAESGSSAGVLLLITIDIGWLQTAETAQLHQVVADGVKGLGVEEVLIQLSHTHAAVAMARPFADPDCPGGRIAMDWWETLKQTAAEAGKAAIAKLELCWINSAIGSCDMAQKRDLWDKAADGFVTAFDPTTYGQADKTVVALRIVAQGGQHPGGTMATVCNYGCHATSLGHPSSLISPDWPGSAREQVDEICGGTCVFVLGASGETMPAQGHQGDPAVTERDGRKVRPDVAAPLSPDLFRSSRITPSHLPTFPPSPPLIITASRDLPRAISKVGLATAAAIIGIPAPGTELVYSGPIVSGAVIGDTRECPSAQHKLYSHNSLPHAYSIPHRTPSPTRTRCRCLEPDPAPDPRSQVDPRGAPVCPHGESASTRSRLPRVGRVSVS